MKGLIESLTQNAFSHSPSIPMVNNDSEPAWMPRNDSRRMRDMSACPVQFPVFLSVLLLLEQGRMVFLGVTSFVTTPWNALDPTSHALSAIERH